ncbi:hypothetical protein C2G38_2151967 [Gigaspora rosea]|uniref:Uncharacterized protein n=1 Tax=Gigaspora rosea TaxID=44941 RepID=A0A397WA89_9GLOM|nr:hypothetical protein C2G38_2151967 [Gigaspora rosea]
MELKDYNQMPPKLLLKMLEGLVHQTTHEIDPPLYALSADNLVKMLCLIRFLAKIVEVNYKPFNLYTGIKEQNILDFIEKAQKKANNDKQEDWIKRMQLLLSTVMNEALLENVLVAIVCILTKIPVFIIGAPGDQTCGTKLYGSGSNKLLNSSGLKSFNFLCDYQQYLRYIDCNLKTDMPYFLSTSDSNIKAFKKAR